ncbi:carbohydrate-binding domain-containing protein [Fibrobacter sp.]|uniref:carbohydrate-binding domain-containing protein n=1 Tax=Fibrobacter sp. TaxID=35828 RepID=UPI00386935E5
MLTRKCLGITSLVSFGLIAGCSSDSSTTPKDDLADITENITNPCVYDGYTAMQGANGETMCLDAEGTLAFWINDDGSYGFPEASQGSDSTDGTSSNEEEGSSTPNESETSTPAETSTTCTTEKALYTVNGISYYKNDDGSLYYFDADCNKASLTAATPASSSSISEDSETAASSASQTGSSSESATANSSAATAPSTSNGNVPSITYATSGATVENNNSCVTVTGGEVVITCAGDYDFSGSYSGADAQIRVYSPKSDSGVYLNLRGLTLTNTADAPIYSQMSSKTFVVPKNGTTNTLSDGSTRTKSYTYVNSNNETKVDTTGACIYAKDDLTIKGEGTLIVKGNYNNGIHTSNDLRVKNGIVTVTAKNNGLKGKESVSISGGTLNITTSNGDGIKSDADDATDLAAGKGSIEITGGEITINSKYDGITANNAIVVAEGESTTPTIKVTSGGGQTCLSQSSSGNGGGMGGGFGGGFGMGGSSCSPDSSMKGFKADSSIAISGGVIEINSRDDGIHSDGNITLSGGKMTIKSDDDGVHAEKALYVKDNANVSVTMAYEGMESPDMNFEGGITSVITTDDGWNAAGGTSTTTGGNTGRGGPGGGWGMGGGSTGKLTVTGGYHYIYVGTGDTDGVDSNGDINISGGVIIVECRMNGGMGGMVDSDGSTSIKNAKLLGFGTNNSEEGTQYSVNFTTENYYGTSEIAFKPSFSGSKMVSSVGQPGVVNSVSGMNKTCFGDDESRCVYTK